MGCSRRGYVLIAVLWALLLCGVLAASFASTARRAAHQAADARARGEARLLARAGCIQGAKDVALALGNRSFAAADLAPGAGASVTSASGGGYQIEGLPEFPPEVAGAGGFMGIIAQRMQELGEARRAREAERGEEPAPRLRETRSERPADTVEVEAPPAPLIAAGVGEFALGERTVRVWQESENGKINLNLAPRWMVASLLGTLGLEPARVEETLLSMEAHRLSVETPEERRERMRLRAADAREAQLAGAPFRRMGELLRVKGFPREIYDELTRAATVTGGGVIDPNYAPRAVWLALGVVDERTLAAISDEQRMRRRITGDRLERLIGASRHRAVGHYFASVDQPVFTVRSRVEIDGVVSRWSIRLTMDESTTPRVLESREGWM